MLADVHRLAGRHDNGLAEREGILLARSETDGEELVRAAFLPQPPPSEMPLGRHYPALPAPPEAAPVPGSRESRPENALLLRAAHVAVPQRELVLEMAQTCIDPCRQSGIGEPWMFHRTVNHLAPGQEFRHPFGMLFFGSTRIIAREMTGFPRSQRGTNFIPIVHGGAEVSQHPGFKVSKLSYFNWQGFDGRGAHRQKLIVHSPHGKLCASRVNLPSTAGSPNGC